MSVPASTAASDCTGCHPREAQAHELSAHAKARSNFVFQAAVKEDDPKWCVGCHAPLSNQPQLRVAPDASPEEAGITCVACHAGSIHGDAGSSHPALASNLSEGSLCAGCHQFGFLLRDSNKAPVALAHRIQQDTVAEWLRYQAATGDPRSCWSCHARGTDHALSGHRPIEALRDAVEVVVRDGALELRTRGVGHAFPTGDVMRWLSVEFSDDGFSFAAPAAVIGLKLQMRQWPKESEPRQGIASDTRLQPGEVRRIAIPSAAVAWQLVYHLVSEGQERRENLNPSLSRNVLHASSLKLGATR